MIKILLPNSDKGRNRASFAPFIRYKKLFELIGVRFVTFGKHDLVFLGNEDFQNRKLPLQDSIEYGINNVSKYNTTVFLIDSSDSTSLMGSIEILQALENTFLVKNQMMVRHHYSEPHPHGKWFWDGSEDTISYNINQADFRRVNLSGYNLGFHDPNYDSFYYSEGERDVDICAIYQYSHDENYDFTQRNDLYYSDHRMKPFEMLKNSEYKVETGKRPYEDYVKVLMNSKIGISPFGMGEICFRDFEMMKFGLVMIKPDMRRVMTNPNPYKEWETYVPVKPDWSDLHEVLNVVLSDWTKYSIIADNFRKKFRNEYLVDNFIRHWYNLLQLDKTIQA
jgi:hypothetical protein